MVQRLTLGLLLAATCLASASNDTYEVDSGVLCVQGDMQGTALQNFRLSIEQNSTFVVVYADSKRDGMDPNAQTFVIVKKPILVQNFREEFPNGLQTVCATIAHKK
jgi:hypothetical protein